jgi:O-antigen ligase
MIALMSADFSHRALVIAAATALPALLAYNLTPAATLFNQLLALTLWGLVLLLWSSELQGLFAGLKTPSALALLLLLPAPWISVAVLKLPLSLGLGAFAILAAALAVLLVAQALSAEARSQAGTALAWGLLITGVLSVVVGLVQVFVPQWADGAWIARSGIAGRAVGNLRQPNHLASLMMWASIAAVYLAASRREDPAWRWGLPVLLGAFMFTVVMSASRTGFIGVGILVLWGLVDGRLSKAARLNLLATPLMLAVGWGVMALWAAGGEHAFGAASRLSEGAGSPSRIAILRDAWGLIKANPWSGVGWGEFNVAWSLTPFPHRPVAFFDHTHNLVVQLAVELGLPWAGLIVVLLAWALWAAFRSAARASGAQDALLRRCMFMVVLMIGLHSMLEYPLWYAYFLLPTAFALGLALPSRPDPTTARGSVLLPLVGILLIAGSAFAAWDYTQRIVVIYAPPEEAPALADRIKTGQRSLLFSHMADYAAATSQPPGADALAAARRTAFSLIDARLLQHWSESLAAVGDEGAARYLADRAREFHNAATEAWLGECERNGGHKAPYQCRPSAETLDWRLLR